jgi:transposase
MFKSYSQNELLLFPPNLGDFIPEDAPVRLISSIVDQLDLSQVFATYPITDDGRPAYYPRMLMKLVLFGYLNNIFSSRNLEECARRDVHMVWLSSYQFPDHTTINRFRNRCAPFIKEIFSDLVHLLVEIGEITLSKDLYIDGSTIRSRAARRKIKWRSNAERFSALAEEEIRKGIADLCEQMEDADEAESLKHQCADCSLEAAQEIVGLLEARAQKEGKKVKGKANTVRRAINRKKAHDETLEQCGDRCGVSPSDPECGIMHAKEDGYEGFATPNYNVQIATTGQYVTNYRAYDTPSDRDTALDFIDSCIQDNGVAPEAVIEDAGYGCEELYIGLEQRGIEAVVKYPGYDKEISPSNKWPAECDRHGFSLSPDGDTLICPAGHTMDVVCVEPDITKTGFPNDTTHMSCSHCQGCPFFDSCPVTANKNGTIGRKLGNFTEERKARKRLDKPVNQERLKRRRLEPEPVFGQIKHNHGFTRFRHFGKTKVEMDLGFLLMAHNIRKLYNNRKKTA